MKKTINLNKGQIIIQTIVFGAIAILLIGGLVGWVGLNIRASKQTFYREQALQIAEAGIDYYRWHLAHAPQDYQDGTGAAGPYIHDFRDKDSNIIGQFILNITPPLLGSTLVVIQSTGKVVADPDISRTIEVKLAKPSLAKYAVVANAAMRFGEGTEVFGPIHSNNGIRFDGLAHNIVSSAVSKYDDPDHDDVDYPEHSYHPDLNNEFGVHTHVNPPPGSGVNNNWRPAETPPNTVPSRTDVFEAGRQFPVPAVDFAGITADLAQMKTDANTPDGFYRTGSDSGLGYNVVLYENDTFELFQVDSLRNRPSGCSNSGQSGWGTWTVQNQSSLGIFPIPLNGIIFLEDNVFIEGKINSARLVIVAAYLPDSPSFRKSITVNKDLLYTNYDGTDVIGLIAQNNINVGLFSEDDLRIDAALIAQNGRVGRYYYENDCSPYHIRQTITLWGMIATNQRYGFAYTDGTGYQIRNLNYDASLLYAPPPSFPTTSDQYITLSWEEIEN